MVCLQNNPETQQQQSLNCKSHLKAVHISNLPCFSYLSKHLLCKSECAGEASVSLFNHPPGPIPPTLASESHCFLFSCRPGRKISTQHRTAQHSMQVWVEQPYGFSHSTNHKGIKETQEEAEKGQKKGGEKERKQQLKASNQTKNMRGRREALTESKIKSQRRSRTGMGRHRRSEYMEKEYAQQTKESSLSPHTHQLT